MQKREEISIVLPQGGDLAVIGGDTAAFMTALEGTKAGAQVFLFPNGAKLLVDTHLLISEGLAAVSTPLQKELGIDFSLEEFREMMELAGKEAADRLLLEAFIEEAESLYALSMNYIDYLDYSDYGEMFFDTIPDPKGEPYLHLPSSLEAGVRFRELLIEKVNNEGVIIRPEKVNAIVFFRDEGDNGALRGVQMLLLENEEGEISPFYVRGVVLADGGYSGDALRWHGNPKWNNQINLRPEQIGKGLQMAFSLKADFLRTDFLYRKIFLIQPHTGQYKEFLSAGGQGVYFFNIEGQVLEVGADIEEIADFIMRSPEGGAFVLVPEELAEELDLDNKGVFRSFNNLDDLARILELKEIPVFRGLYYRLTYHTAPVSTGICFTPGGLAVTPLGEVKDVHGEIIPGLFAAGEIVGGLHGEGMLPGMALSETLFFSRRVGMSAAEHVRR